MEKKDYNIGLFVLLAFVGVTIYGLNRVVSFFI